MQVRHGWGREGRSPSARPSRGDRRPYRGEAHGRTPPPCRLPVRGVRSPARPSAKCLLATRRNRGHLLRAARPQDFNPIAVELFAPPKRFLGPRRCAAAKDLGMARGGEPIHIGRRRAQSLVERFVQAAPPDHALDHDPLHA